MIPQRVVVGTDLNSPIFYPLPHAEQVLETVPAIKKYSGMGPEAFPRRPGLARELNSPALEFIKSLCHVLSLDVTVTDAVSSGCFTAGAEGSIAYNDERILFPPHPHQSPGPRLQ